MHQTIRVKRATELELRVLVDRARGGIAAENAGGLAREAGERFAADRKTRGVALGQQPARHGVFAARGGDAGDPLHGRQLGFERRTVPSGFKNGPRGSKRRLDVRGLDIERRVCIQELNLRGRR